MARRSCCPRGPTSPSSSTASAYRARARRRLPRNPLRPRAATVAVRTAVQRRATAYLRDTPPTRRENSAALVAESGPSRTAPPSRPFRRRINVTKNIGVLTSQCGKQHLYQCANPENRVIAGRVETPRLRSGTRRSFRVTWMLHRLSATRLIAGDGPTPGSVSGAGSLRDRVPCGRGVRETRPLGTGAGKGRV